MNAPTTFDAKLRRDLVTFLEEDMSTSPLDRVDVRALDPSGGESTVLNLSGGALSGKDVSVESIADKILRAVERDASDVYGVARYVVRTHGAGDYNRARFKLVVQGRGLAPSDAMGLATSHAGERTNEALLSYLSRKEELYERRTETIVNAQARQLEALASRIDGMLERDVRVLQLIQELTDRQFERDSRRRMMTAAGRQLETHLPALFDVLAKRFGLALPAPAQSSAQLVERCAALAAAAFGKLAPEHVAQLREGLTEPRRAQLDAVLAEHAKRSNGSRDDAAYVRAVIELAGGFNEAEGATFVAVLERADAAPAFVELREALLQLGRLERSAN